MLMFSSALISIITTAYFIMIMRSFEIKIVEATHEHVNRLAMTSSYCSPSNMIYVALSAIQTMLTTVLLVSFEKLKHVICSDQSSDPPCLYHLHPQH
jgi:hypothetical protein